MKIRNGFVSNSSSSSFLIVLPDNYTIDKNNTKKLMEYEGIEYSIEDVMKKIKEFIEYGYIEEYDNAEYFYILRELFYDYSIYSTDVSSDEGVLTFKKKSEIIEKINNIT